MEAGYKFKSAVPQARCGMRQEDLFTVYVWCFLSPFSFLLFCSWNIFTLQCTSLSSTRFLQAVGHLTSALGQQQVLAGLMIDWVSGVFASVAAAVVAEAAAAVVEAGVVEVAAQTPVVEVR